MVTPLLDAEELTEQGFASHGPPPKARALMLRPSSDQLAAY
jgi:hypothetical protein